MYSELPLDIGRYEINYVQAYWKDGVRSKTKTPIKPKVCPDEFVEKGSYRVPLSDRMACLDKEGLDITLRGNFFAEIFEYIEMKLMLCPTYNETVNCASPDEVKAFFKKRFDIHTYFANNLVNVHGESDG